MFELLFLLLPIAAVYGYFVGRGSVKQKIQNSKHNQNADYLKGFDYLLNNKQEKAVDKFIAYFNSKDPSFESSIALGNLFRQRGQVDKAISLHEKMSNDSNLEDSERELSLLELANDFISAGLLDRAENILLSLVDIPRQRKSAAKLLLSVYEKEQDFEKAIAVSEKYSQALEKSADKQVSQYHCEIAKRFVLNSQYKEAESELYKAISCNEKSVRARLELADILIKQSDLKKAHGLIKEAYTLDSSCAMVCIDKLKLCFQNSADPNYRFALEDLVHRTSSAQAMVELVKVVEQISGQSDAQALLLSYTQNTANLKLVSQLLSLRAHSSDPSANESILQIKSMLDAQISLSNRYICPNCGFESKILFWQCPSCRKWESMKTKVGLDGD